MAISHCNTAWPRFLLGLTLIVATWAAVTPNPPVPMLYGLHGDKWAHLATYLLLALLLDASWPKREFDLPKWAFLLGYGIAIELIQSLIPSRMFSLADIAVNAAGVALYALLISRLLRETGVRGPTG